MLEEFKVQNAPAALQEIVQKHNALVELIGMMRGVNGIYTHVSRGGIVLSANPTGLAGTGQPASNGTSGNVGGTIQAVGSNGALFDVVQPVSPNAPSGYPNYLRVSNNTTNRSYIQPFEIICENTTFGVYAGLTPTSIELSGAHQLYILESALTADMAIKEIDVCDGNVAKKMLIIASDPY